MNSFKHFNDYLYYHIYFITLSNTVEPVLSGSLTKLTVCYNILHSFIVLLLRMKNVQFFTNHFGPHVCSSIKHVFIKLEIRS